MIPEWPVVVVGGQSNTQGSSPSPGGVEGGADFAAGTMPPDPTIGFCANDNFGEHTARAPLGMVPWGDTIGNGLRAPHHGPEQKLGARLKAAGWTNITILKWTHNGTIISAFLPGGADWYRLQRVITAGHPPATNITPFFIWMQGESDALSTSSLAQANDWGNKYNTLYAAVTAAVGKPLVGGKIIGRIHNDIYGASQPSIAPYVANVRAEQARVADHLIDCDGLALYPQDHLHYPSASQHAFGDSIADRLLSIVG